MHVCRDLRMGCNRVKGSILAVPKRPSKLRSGLFSDSLELHPPVVAGLTVSGASRGPQLGGAGDGGDSVAPGLGSRRPGTLNASPTVHKGTTGVSLEKLFLKS